MNSDNWQKKAKTFRQVKYGSPSLGWTQGLEYRVELVQKYIDFQDKKVLDVGCGIGMFLEKFKELGSDVYGIDVDSEKIKKAKKKFKNVQVAPSEKLPFRKGTIDIVWLHEVLEHVENDKRTLGECFRVLKPGGKLVIFVPNRLWPFETHGVFWHDKYKFGNVPFVTYFPNFYYKHLTPHVRNYYRRDIYKLIKGVSYKKIHYQGVFPGFDKISRKVPIIGPMIKKIFRLLEKTPLNRFGLSHLIILEKL